MQRSKTKLTMNYKWLRAPVTELYFSVLVVHYCTQGGEAQDLTVTPTGAACPGIDMTFTCRKTSNTGTSISSIRWKLLRDGTEVIPQLTLSQGGCSHLFSSYNNLPILVTLYSSYSTLNITADDQLHGLTAECLLVSDTVERATLLIHITQPPSPPTGLRISNHYHGSYSAIIDLQWDSLMIAEATTYTISVTSNRETWTSTASRTDGRKSIALSYNTNYTLDVTVKNCAGHSARGALDMMNIFIVNCSIPLFTTEIVTEPYNSTVEGAIIYFHCAHDNRNERRMVVCQSNGQWSTNLSNIKCGSDQDTRINSLEQLLNDKEQCERDFGTFLTLCTQNDTVKCIETDEGPKAVADYQRIEVLVGLTVASFVLGLICGGCFLLPVCLIAKKKHDSASENKNIELNENMAYETIPFPTHVAKSID